MHHMTEPPIDKIRLSTLLAYAAPAFALAVVGIPIYVYIPKFYTDGFRLVDSNRAFLILLISYTISALGNNLPATLILFCVQYVLLSPHADLFLLVYFVTGVLFLPAWVRLSVHMGKERTWILSMGVSAGAFVGVFFLGPQDVWIYAVLGVGISLYALGASGYRPNAPQPPEVVLTLRILYALALSLCNIAALLIARAYPIDQKTHEKIKRAIAVRKSGGSVEDPLRPGRLIAP